jgi:hypothetical protein
MPGERPEFYLTLRQIIREEMKHELDERRSIEADTHAQQHQWIAARIARDKAIAEFCWNATKIIMQWGIPAVLTVAAAKFFGIKLPG